MMSRSVDLHAYFTPEEVDRIHERMAEACVTSRSAFIRKMALDGYIVKLDMDEITEMITLLRRSSNNLNQIAKKVNSTGTIYGEEIAQIRNGQDEIWKLSREILAQLSALS